MVDARDQNPVKKAIADFAPIPICTVDASWPDHY